MGRTLLALQKTDEAEPLLVRGLEGLRSRVENLPDKGREQLILALTPLAELYRVKGNAEMARKCEAELRELESSPGAR